MNVIPISIIGMNTNTKEITENERKYKRQKYRHYGEYFINLPVVGLPCFFGFLTSTTFARKKRTKFHHFIRFIECFYLNLQSISIAPFKELKRIGLTFTIADVGAEIGIPLMSIGGYISLGARGMAALSYAYQGKFKNFAIEGGKIATEIGVGKLSKYLIKPIGRKIGDETINQALGSQLNGMLTSEAIIPLIEQNSKTVN